MRYAIISDIHSNLEALEVVVEDITKTGVEKIICCGDIVGYGPNPKECISLLKTLNNIDLILGNHDAALISKIELKDFNYYAKKAIEINKTLTSEDEIKYLASLNETYCRDDIFCVHGSPRDPINEYLTTIKRLRDNVAIIKEKVCFCGHTHLPFVYAYTSLGTDYVENIYDGKEIKLLDDRKYIINIGSVGQPRDDDNRSCFVYYDSEDKKIIFKRLSYDIVAVQEKMKKLNFPEFLIARLSLGR
jgi:putative phosphoesterase